jgi:hypothetical protein
MIRIQIRKLCEHGINDEDQYIEACSLIALLYGLKSRTYDQQKQLESLCNVVYPYEEKNYPYGN